MKAEDKSTVNITLKIENSQLTNFENYLDQNLNLISFKLLHNTDELYKKDDVFKKLVKNVKKATTERDKYINEHNK